jgi:uncharacterized membrane protein
VTRSIRKHLADRSVGSAPGFRWRAGEVSRLEGFTDAVFAFAVTLLVVSLEVPHTFSDLVAAMRGFAAFAVCFLLLFLIWYEHYVYSRRYGLDDPVVVWLNGALIFVVLFYVYPLKFVFTLLINSLLGYPVGIHRPDGTVVSPLEPADAPNLFLIYGAGYVAVFVVFALLYLHAYRKRKVLGLTPLEVFDTRASLVGMALLGSVGVLSIVVTLAFGERASGASGWIYLLNGPIQTAQGFWFGKRRQRLEAKEATA